MDWIDSIPEPFRTIVATILALLGLLLLVSPLFLVAFCTGQILMSDTEKNQKMPKSNNMGK